MREGEIMQARKRTLLFTEYVKWYMGQSISFLLFKTDISITIIITTIVTTLITLNVITRRISILDSYIITVTSDSDQFPIHRFELHFYLFIFIFKFKQSFLSCVHLRWISPIINMTQSFAIKHLRIEKPWGLPAF